MKLAVFGIVLILIGVFVATGLRGGVTGYGVSFLGYNLNDTQLSGWALSIVGGIINIARVVKWFLERVS